MVGCYSNRQNRTRLNHHREIFFRNYSIGLFFGNKGMFVAKQFLQELDKIWEISSFFYSWCR